MIPLIDEITELAIENSSFNYPFDAETFKLQLKELMRESRRCHCSKCDPNGIDFEKYYID